MHIISTHKQQIKFSEKSSKQMQIYLLYNTKIPTEY